MARAKTQPPKRKRARKQKRSDADYILSAQKLAYLVPSFKPLAKRKRLKPWQKSAITRKEKILKGVPDIFPITAKQAKQMRGQVFASGVHGIQLRGVSPTAKIKFKGKDLIISDHGREWLYWHLSRATVRSRPGMRTAGKKAFTQQFPIELVSQLAERAFKTKNVVQVNLWAHAGVVGDPHETLKEFVQWVNEKWSAGRYVRTAEQGGNSDPGKWVNGIAILLEDKEYARKRAAKIAENKGVQAEMERKGREARERERKRLSAKGLADASGKKLKKKPKTKSKSKRK